MAQTKKKKPAAKAKSSKKPVKKSAAPQMKKSSSPAQPAKKSAPNLNSMITPLDDRLIVSPEAAAQKTEGGIIIPGSVSERPSRGTVMAKGRGRRNKKGVIRPLDVNVGDVVLFPQFAGQKIEIGADEFLILREEEILAVSLA